MAILLFKLRNVPPDEANEVRALLTDHGVDFYETSAGNWNLSMPGIWLRDESQLGLAQQLLRDYQDARLHQARSHYDQLRKEGRLPTVTTLFRTNPLKFTGCCVLVILVLYITLGMFPGL